MHQSFYTVPCGCMRLISIALQFFRCDLPSPAFPGCLANTAASGKTNCTIVSDNKKNTVCIRVSKDGLHANEEVTVPYGRSYNRKLLQPAPAVGDGTGPESTPAGMKSAARRSHWQIRQPCARCGLLIWSRQQFPHKARCKSKSSKIE